MLDITDMKMINYKLFDLILNLGIFVTKLFDGIASVLGFRTR